MANRKGGQTTITEMQDTSMDRIMARGVSKVAVYASPWIVGVLILGLGSAFHFILDSDDPETVAWTSWFMAFCSAVLAAVAYGQSHARGPWGRTHTTLTTFLAGLWVCGATFQGVLHPIFGRLSLIGGVTLVLTWNIRSAIRHTGLDTPGAVQDKLGWLFGHGAEAAGMPGVQARTTKIGQHKVEGKVQLEQGQQVAEDLQKKVKYIESGVPLPPGSIIATLDPDDASQANVSVSDPRVLRNRIPWPGPSRPNGSIGEAIRLGLWQDLDPVEWTILGAHVVINGMTGSGKSIGGAWNFLAEAGTRYDVAIFAADTAKQDQTLGPLRPMLHRFETDIKQVRAMLRRLHEQAPKRTQWLAERGFQKWVPGCGLAYWIVWLEEFPKIFDALPSKEQDKFLELVKELRSAGGTIAMSLQRSDYSQMPTLARGQGAKWCFGLESAKDAKFGLSEAQQETGAARPELWANKRAGMSYLDAPSIPEERIAMPNRTWDWGESDQEANARMRRHAESWPAAAKEVDEFTAIICANYGPDAVGDEDREEDDEDDPMAEHVKTEDPSPDIEANADDPIEPLNKAKFPPRPAPKMPPEQARGVLLEQLAAWVRAGREEFATRDLKEVKERTGYSSRGWLNDQLTLLAEDGVIERDDIARCYRILRADLLAGDPAGV
ncbi:hypothetical protein [Sphaerisporangium sp. TRM90804]|uniref:hypothetical protein n=1 Tax=Sphaerisporangium sp. TRM90804 TaxID=3031113 RepID=UPI0024482B3C|nr:hypothetical protein [Sphaerisporangium sp. TRM90804]MDH2429298.1 hypothetical protein [Sphaerisporangium sp. TRM90804]